MVSNEFVRECVERHNFYRGNHGVESLVLSEQLSKSAQAWADKLSIMVNLEHSKAGENRPPKTGENVFSIWSSEQQQTVSGEHAVNSWYRK